MVKTDFLEVGYNSCIICDVSACLAVGKTSTSASYAGSIADGAEVVVGSQGGIVEVARWTLVSTLIIGSVEEVGKSTFGAICCTSNTEQAFS